MQLPAPAVLAPGLVLLAACSGGSSSTGHFQIETCSLGCTDAGTGGPLGCGVDDVFSNADVRVTFTAPVDPASVDALTLRVVDASGASPPATRFVDPDDPCVVVFRPQLGFDSSGDAVLGLTAGQHYTLDVPGADDGGPGPFVRSTAGEPNERRLLCGLHASLGVLDFEPGPPTVTATVEQVVTDPQTGEVALDPATGAALTVPVLAAGAEDVWLFSRVVLSFDETMHPQGLVDPVSGTSAAVEVLLDPDGVVSDPSDQLVVPGAFTIALDQDAGATTVVFTPEGGFPSAGAAGHRRVVVRLAPWIADVAGEPLANPGELWFTPQAIAFPVTTLVESFAGAKSEDAAASGAGWGGGALVAGPGGGSGRLGALALAPGEVVTLGTDVEDFAGVPETTYPRQGHLDATFDGAAFAVPPVVGGVFELASLRIPAGARLRLVGEGPARLYIRGTADVQGTLDVSGADGGPHDDALVLGGTSAEPGPGGARGGDGGRQPTWVGFEELGATVPRDPELAPPTPPELDGRRGGDVGGAGGGAGGLAWPQPTAAAPGHHMPADPTDLGGLVFDLFWGCRTKMKGGVGAGGGHGLAGSPGQDLPMLAPGLVAPEPPAVAGGAPGDGLGPGSDPQSPPRTLDPDAGWLRGGAGGGGGGAHLAETASSGIPFADCTTTGAGPAVLATYVQHSGAAGGAGGGALQLQAGRRITVGGVLDASGGQAQGRAAGVAGGPAAGGGGAGGAVLLQAPALQVLGHPGSLDVSGGPPAVGIGGSPGGRGGAGLVRLETAPPLPAVASEAKKLAPAPEALAAAGAAPGDVLSIGPWTPKAGGPDGRSGAQSCWLRPEGGFLELAFEEDRGEGDDLVPGWDLQVHVLGLGEVSWRQPLAGGPSLEEIAGSTLGASPLVVRFQAARWVEPLADPCAPGLLGPGGDLVAGSLTGWAAHPAELSDVFGDPALRPNRIRFQVIFDAADPLFPLLLGVTEVTIRTQPD